MRGRARGAFPRRGGARARRRRPGRALTHEEWLAAVPRLVAELAELWSIEPGEPFRPPGHSWVAPAGEHAVLKLTFPQLQTEREGDALVHWDGDGAVRVLERDEGRSALLLERCDPGTDLWELDEALALPIAAETFRRLWRPAPAEHSFVRLEDEAVRWREAIPERWERAGRPFERDLLDRGLAALRELGPSQGPQVVCHQDFQGSNVLLSARGWLAIDPKPVVGEREFDTASFLRDRRFAFDAGAMRLRLERLAADLGLDRERMRGWAVAHSLAWGLARDGSSHDPAIVESARVFR